MYRLQLPVKAQADCNHIVQQDVEGPPGHANEPYWRCVYDEEGMFAPRQVRLGEAFSMAFGAPQCWFPPTGPGNNDDHYGGCVVAGRDVVFTEQVETGNGFCWFPPGVPSPDRSGSGYAKCLLHFGTAMSAPPAAAPPVAARQGSAAEALAKGREAGNRKIIPMQCGGSASPPIKGMHVPLTT